MKESKKFKIDEARNILKDNSLLWIECHQTHFKVGLIDFWPTTGKWICPDDNTTGRNIKSLIEHIKKDANKIPSNKLSVEQLFQIAAKCKNRSTMGICTAIHREIYK